MEVYIHIPFCVRKCTYCAFDSFPGCSCPDMAEYLSAVLREAEIRKAEISSPVKTVYIGGGTPSLIPVDIMISFLKKLEEIFCFSSVQEFTIEANPGTVSVGWMKAVKESGVNRVSFGMQAAQPRLLNTLGRIHSMEDTAEAVHMAMDQNIPHINLDLIFGIPGQSEADWEETVSAAINLNPDHISAYGLIPEDGTPLQQQLKTGLLALPDPDLERKMYDDAIRRLSEAGLIQYEISNFSRKGCECLHNIGYWDQIPYLGLGLGAASMRRTALPSDDVFSIRRTNPHTFSSYYKMLKDPVCPGAETELIFHEDARFETLMLSLRMTKGMNRFRFRHLHGNDPEAFYGEKLYELEQKGLLVLKDNSWRLTRRGMDIQNTILLEFL